MSSKVTTAQQRRGKPQQLRPEPTILVESPDGKGGKLVQRSPELAAAKHQQAASMAVVKRSYCGTGPFDKHWLNVDCCGFICAAMTYGLLGYGVYAVNFILLPPWMSYHGTDNIRFMSVAGHFHQTLFCVLVSMAIVSHFKAMTTDPGAVPPDAKPLPDPDDIIEQQNEGEGEGEDGGQKPLLQKQQPQRSLRLCRRCKSFKPQRAHHCSLCKRCIIKMDHHCPVSLVFFWEKMFD